jgi:hypothetical protein
VERGAQREHQHTSQYQLVFRRKTEGVEYDARGEPTKDWIATARRWQDKGNPQIASLLGNFTEDNDEMRSVLATERPRPRILNGAFGES